MLVKTNGIFRCAIWNSTIFYYFMTIMLLLFLHVIWISRTFDGFSFEIYYYCYIMLNMTYITSNAHTNVCSFNKFQRITTYLYTWRRCFTWLWKRSGIERKQKQQKIGNGTNLDEVCVQIFCMDCDGFNIKIYMVVIAAEEDLIWSFFQRKFTQFTMNKC